MGEVVLAGSVVPMPGDDIERRVVEGGAPQVPLKLGDYLKGAVVAVVICGMRCEEVAGVGQAVGSDGAKLGQTEAGSVVLENVAASLRVVQLDTKLDAARNEGDLAGGEAEDAELGVECEAAKLRHEQK